MNGGNAARVLRIGPIRGDFSSICGSLPGTERKAVGGAHEATADDRIFVRIEERFQKNPRYSLCTIAAIGGVDGVTTLVDGTWLASARRSSDETREKMS